MANLTKEDIRIVLNTIQEVYLADKIPWICGYSGGKDSTAVVQLVWIALSQLPKDKLHKPVHVISTDTLVESPVVALWTTRSLARMKEAANNPEHKLPIIPHRLVPEVTNTFWVNLIGRGYPYPRRDFRWCTDRMKIDPCSPDQILHDIEAVRIDIPKMMPLLPRVIPGDLLYERLLC